MSQNKKKAQLSRLKQRQNEKKIENKNNISSPNEQKTSDNPKQDELSISIEIKKESLLRRLAKERVFLDIDCFSKRMNESYSKKKLKMLHS